MIEDLTLKFKIDHKKTILYHLESNGNIKQVNQILIYILKLKIKKRLFI